MSSGPTAVAAALGAAVAYAVASAFQHRAARSAADQGGRCGGAAFARLACSPVWLLGLLADVAAVGLHVVALTSGPVTLVQPLQAAGLVFALILSATLDRRRPRMAEVVGGALVAGGLGLFFLTVASAPHAPQGPHGLRADALLAVMSIAGILCATTVAVARRLVDQARAVVLGIGAGSCFAVASVLAAGLSHAGSTGWRALGTPVSLVTLAGAGVVGVGGLVLSQAAFGAADLGAGLPALTVSDPVVAVVLAAAVLGEPLNYGPGHVLAGLLAAALVAVGAVWLCRAGGHGREPSPTAHGTSGQLPSEAGLVRRHQVRPVHRGRVPRAGRWVMSCGWTLFGVVSGGAAAGALGVAALARWDSDSSLSESLLIGSVAVCAGSCSPWLARQHGWTSR